MTFAQAMRLILIDTMIDQPGFLFRITQIGAIQERDRRECRAPQQEKD